MVTRVCVSVRSPMPTLLHGPGCNLGLWYRMPPSCVLLDGFAIDARVALLWQHNANASYKCERERLASVLFSLYAYCFICMIDSVIKKCLHIIVSAINSMFLSDNLVPVCLPLTHLFLHPSLLSLFIHHTPQSSSISPSLFHSRFKPTRFTDPSYIQAYHRLFSQD